MILIVPYRDRLEHLQKFVEHYKGLKILVVEQANDKLFNRGKLFNVGFNESKDDIVIFHDVDLLVHDSWCYLELDESMGAVHLSGLCEQFNYKVPYETCFGGVTAFDSDSFLKCNGFSNDFWGWGGEDDDLYNRAKLAGINVRFAQNKYYSLKHEKQPITQHYQINKRLCTQTDKTWLKSGLNSMRYEVIKKDTIFGVQRILVNI
jgi:predicted glycosyltransferase involved in capsule biosynthesis